MAAVKVPTGYSSRRTKNFHQAQDSGPGLFYFSSPFEDVEICEMIKVNGSMRRPSLNELPIPAGGRVELDPGNLHLLLKERQEKLSAGDKVDLTLNFDSGAKQTIIIRVIDQ